MRGTDKITYGLVLFPNFPMMAFSALVEPLRAANILAGRDVYDWHIVGRDTQPVASSSGLGISPHRLISENPVFDRVVICSGGDADRVQADDEIAWIRRLLSRGANVGAVADGAFVLARAGLLDGFRCTLHWTSQPAFAEAFPNVFLERSLFVIDRTRFTALGGIGALDMQLALIAQDIDAGLAHAVADWFAHSILRSPAERQPMPLNLRTGIRDRLVLNAVADMEAHMEEPLNIADIAARQGVSSDTLERAFQTELGTTPGRYQRRLRLRLGRALLEHSEMQIRDIAQACGYGDQAAFSRAFRAEYGLSPIRTRSAI